MHLAGASVSYGHISSLYKSLKLYTVRDVIKLRERRLPTVNGVDALNVYAK